MNTIHWDGRGRQPSWSAEPPHHFVRNVYSESYHGSQHRLVCLFKNWKTWTNQTVRKMWTYTNITKILCLFVNKMKAVSHNFNRLLKISIHITGIHLSFFTSGLGTSGKSWLHLSLSFWEVTVLHKALSCFSECLATVLTPSVFQKKHKRKERLLQVVLYRSF